jgi:hypothetical protein
MIDLPAPLPAGEEVLWEGAPRTWSFLRQVAHPRILAAYVALLVLSCVYTGAHGGDLHGALVASGKFTGLSVVAFVLLAGIARLQVGSTDYIITNRRVMITFGAALGKTLQIPFTSIEAAALRAHGDGTGDLVLTLVPSQKVNFFLLWPNVRPMCAAAPWRLRHERRCAQPPRARKSDHSTAGAGVRRVGDRSHHRGGGDRRRPYQAAGLARAGDADAVVRRYAGWRGGGD